MIGFINSPNPPVRHSPTLNIRRPRFSVIPVGTYHGSPLESITEDSGAPNWSATIHHSGADPGSDSDSDSDSDWEDECDYSHLACAPISEVRQSMPGSNIRRQVRFASSSTTPIPRQIIDGSITPPLIRSSASSISGDVTPVQLVTPPTTTIDLPDVNPVRVIGPDLAGFARRWGVSREIALNVIPIRKTRVVIPKPVIVEKPVPFGGLFTGFPLREKEPLNRIGKSMRASRERYLKLWLWKGWTTTQCKIKKVQVIYTGVGPVDLLKRIHKGDITHPHHTVTPLELLTRIRDDDIKRTRAWYNPVGLFSQVRELADAVLYRPTTGRYLLN